VVFVIDITERKRAELERQKLLHLQADLAHVGRISLMGELAAITWRRPSRRTDVQVS
jgi:hypothetical protein